ncbi:MAG: 5-formyltetrahydrofolate cyclo-ligase [Rhodothermales bacterium]
MHAEHPAKSDLRSRFDAYRRSLTPAEHAERSAAIATRIAALPAFQAARCIHAYWPLERRREIDLRPLLLAAYGLGKQILLPVVIPQTHTGMTHRLFEGADRLRAGSWGVHEPAGDRTVPDAAIDLIIVPALGADRFGYRLGYGKGYYDAFLAGLAAPTVCPVFEACLVDALPREPHDVPVSYLATESRMIRVSHPDATTDSAAP